MVGSAPVLPSTNKLRTSSTTVTASDMAVTCGAGPVRTLTSNPRVTPQASMQAPRVVVFRVLLSRCSAEALPLSEEARPRLPKIAAIPVSMVGEENVHSRAARSCSSKGSGSLRTPSSLPFVAAINKLRESNDFDKTVLR
jgi:hypothetical protein